MTLNRFNALDFEYLLLEFYKEMNINEKELSVILMLDHLISQENDFITNDLLALKMNLTLKEIDECMTNLYKKKYIEFNVIDGKPSTSVNPLKKILSSKFEKSLFTDEEFKENKSMDEEKQRIFAEFDKVFCRELSPIEYSHIEEWIKNEIPEEIIVNSLKDAKSMNKLSIRTIEKIIYQKTEEN
ncbi:MAG: DnaD domain protein [Bacilli bacterium]